MDEMYCNNGPTSSAPAPSERIRVRRRKERAAYEREVIDAILDEGLVCHVGFAVDGQPFVLPMAYARLGGRLVIHGASGARLLRTLVGGVPVCVTVTLLDGLVLARSAFHHSVNYRSVVVLGVATEITDEVEKARALEAIVEHVAPGRTADVRAPTAAEMRATRVLALPLDEASAKRRSGPPLDDEDDLALPCWAGVLPLAQVPGRPVADAALPDGIPVPAYVTAYRRP
jgi:nitroimidazol reductase NimA-like FMN-containing flavoprotein (pyridoxamine 5'-phosphate oxidase superfamily)